jgi:hypothetical protein
MAFGIAVHAVCCLGQAQSGHSSESRMVLESMCARVPLTCFCQHMPGRRKWAGLIYIG